MCDKMAAEEPEETEIEIQDWKLGFSDEERRQMVHEILESDISREKLARTQCDFHRSPAPPSRRPLSPTTETHVSRSPFPSIYFYPQSPDLLSGTLSTHPLDQNVAKDSSFD